ncbi:MAG: class I SAM-dependent methyltransferase [Verrucomicrobiota bacterium]
MEANEYQTMFLVEETHWWYTGLQDLVLRRVGREAANWPVPLEILDAGCGTGRLCQLLKPFGAVTACDIHPLAVTATKRRGVERVRQFDLGSDVLEQERFDLITLMDVLYHQNVTNEAAVLANLHRALRKQGLLILQVAAFNNLLGAHDQAVHTRRRYRREEVVRLLEAAGFTVEFASYRLFPLFFPMFAWRRLRPGASPIAGTGTPKSDLNVTCSPFLNWILNAYVRLENRLLCGGLRLPVGTSVFVIARKE